MNIIMFKYKELMLLSFSLLLIQIACYIIIHTRTHTNTYFQMPNILQINWNIILFSLRYDWLDAQSCCCCFASVVQTRIPKQKKKRNVSKSVDVFFVLFRLQRARVQYIWRYLITVHIALNSPRFKSRTYCEHVYHTHNIFDTIQPIILNLNTVFKRQLKSFKHTNCQITLCDSMQ